MAALPEHHREEIAAILEELSHGDLQAKYALGDEQIADLRRRNAEPGKVAACEDWQ